MRLLRDQGTTGKFAADHRDVYVIDDDPGIRSALGRLFRSVGLHAELFASANELRRHELPSVPSCLVLDVRLPGPSGFELHAELTKADVRFGTQSRRCLTGW
jgi:FixJ family two-component response regulator